MRHSFSSEFLKISQPATNFGEAWENLCLCLLRADTSDGSIMRLGPPDRGIDIYRQRTRAAYQCKSSERGIFGTIDAQECITSLGRAIQVRDTVKWDDYAIALNAQITGTGLLKIKEYAASQGLSDDAVVILPPEHWDDLCERHIKAIKHLFDYRVFVTEPEVIEAFRKARYYDQYVTKFEHQIKISPLTVTVSNNRTPVEVTLPFSGELTIEQLLDVVQSILGISLDWANFPDLDTSCGPSLSITIDRVALPFKRKLSELTAEQREKLQLWIKLTWQDKLKTDGDHYDGTVSFNMLYRWHGGFGEGKQPISERERGQRTLDRMTTMLQDTIWQTLSKRG
jgi:hypothetical protein